MEIFESLPTFWCLNVIRWFQWKIYHWYSELCLQMACFRYFSIRLFQKRYRLVSFIYYVKSCSLELFLNIGVILIILHWLGNLQNKIKIKIVRNKLSNNLNGIFVISSWNDIETRRFEYIFIMQYFRNFILINFLKDKFLLRTI